MDRWTALASRLLRDERGATAIEYGLVASLVSITIIVWAQMIGVSVVGFLNSVAGGLTGF